MVDEDNNYLPFLYQICNKKKLYLPLGDTLCLCHNIDSSNKKSNSSIKKNHIDLFLPGNEDGGIFCYFSVLFDGSVLLCKEKRSGSTLNVFINGHRLANGNNVSIQSGDIIVLGTLNHSYIVDLQDQAKKYDTLNNKKIFGNISTEILLHGDLMSSILNDKTGKAMELERSFLHKLGGVSVSIISSNEIIEWIQWMGLSSTSLSTYFYEDLNVIDLRIKM